MVHSKMVAMGVATAALVTGMQAQGRAAVYTDPREFAEMRAKAIGP